MALNVNRNVEDTFYRYKMPKLQAKVEGKGNGIKTVIANMTDIAKALNRPPGYPTKYFGCELGAQTQIDLKNERYIVNGEHTQDKLQETLDGFIKRYVLCPGCDNPETTLKVRGKNAISQKCKACGYAGQLDMKHKLTAYIVKNPPPEDTADSSGGAKSNGAVANGEDHADGAPMLNGHGGLTNGALSGAAALEGDDDWEPDTDTVPAEQLTDRMKALIVSDDMARPEDERLDMFYKWLKENKDGKATENGGKACLAEADRLDIRDKAPLLMASVLYTEGILKDIEANRAIFFRFVKDNARAQKYLLGGVEQVIVAHKATLLKQTPLVLKALYDEDLVDEETMLAWGKKASKKYVSRADSKAILAEAAPMLKWLEEAESDSESDDDDVDVDFNSAAPATGVTATKTAAKSTTVEEDSNDDSNDGSADVSKDDDLNIDDI